MKKLLFLLLACTFFVSACGSLRIGPKGEGEYVKPNRWFLIMKTI